MKTLTLAVLAALLVVSIGARTEAEFKTEFVSWMKRHNKSFQPSEFKERYGIWKKNQLYIDTHNAEYEKGVHSYKLEMNRFGSMTNEEFAAFYNGFRPFENPNAEDFEVPAYLGATPTSWDWRDYGAVTPVKNQLQCGSCYTFSTTGSMEGCLQIKTKKLISFSEQNLIDCSSNLKYGNHGCNGGLMTNAMDYIIANKGLDTEESYPYEAKQGSCRYNATYNMGTLTGYQNIKKGNESDLQYAAWLGPVSVAIDASQSSFQFYKSGVYYAPKCSSTNLDHGVLLVGWGVDGADQYWIVKNSWGTDWGQAGYIWMARNKDNNCGIATQATRPTC